MAIDRPSAFEVLGANGREEWAEGEIVGEDDGWAAAIRNNNHLDAFLCRRVAMSWSGMGAVAAGQPIEETNTSTPQVRLETCFQAGAERWGETNSTLAYTVVHAGGDVTVAAYTADGTTLLGSATHTRTTRGLNSGTIDISASSDGDVLIQIFMEWDGVTGTACELYAIHVQEQAVALSDLSDLKTDTDLGASQAGLNGFLTKRVVYGVHAINEKRYNGGTIVYDPTNPPLIGAIQEMFHPLDLPVSAEAKQVQLRLRYKVRHGDVRIRGSVGKAEGERSDPSAAVTLSSTGSRATSDWITIELAEHHRGRFGGEELARVMLLVLSTKVGTPTASVAINDYIEGWYINTSGTLPATYDPEDVLSITPYVSSKVAPGGAEDMAQVIRHTPGGDELWIYPPMPRIGVNALTMTLWSLLELVAIEWREVIGPPYSAPRPTFPWESAARTHRTVTVGQQGSAQRLLQPYNAQRHLFRTRTPAWCVRPGQPGSPVTSWETQEAAILPYRDIFVPGSDTAEYRLFTVPVGLLTGLTGAAATAAGVSFRTGIEITPLVAVFGNLDGPSFWTFRARSVNDAFVTQTAHDDPDLHAEATVQLHPLEDDSYSRLILAHGRRRVALLYRNNLQGLWPVQQVGQLGVQYGPTLLLNDLSGGDFVEVVVARDGALSTSIRETMLLLGAVVRPARGLRLGEMGS